MNRASQKTEQPSDTEFIISRIFNAPRPVVWQAWSDCDHLKHWWAPAGWMLSACDLDFRVGGTWHYCMKGSMPDGTEAESWGLSVYQEIVEPERIVVLDQFADEAGNVSAEMPKMLNTVSFAEIEGGTHVTSHIEFAKAADLETVITMGMEEGVTQSWDQLAAHLAEVQG